MLDTRQYVLNGFPASTSTTIDPVPCFSSPDVTGARLLGRIYQRLEATYTPSVGTRPEDCETKCRHSASTATGFRSPRCACTEWPPQGSALSTVERVGTPPKHLEAEPLFVKYDFHILVPSSFAAVTGPSDRKNIAMFWSSSRYTFCQIPTAISCNRRSAFRSRHYWASRHN